MTVGSFQVFIAIVTLICVLHVKVNVFQESMTFIFFVQTDKSFLEDIYVKLIVS
jgi:hypothetical protein